MSKSISKIKKNMIGLEIGSGGIKIVQSDFVKEELIVKNVVTASLPDSVCTDGEIVKPEVLVSTLKNALKTNKIKEKDCFCCMDSSQIITREVMIPNLNKDNLQEMAKFEVEQYLPIEMENYVVQSVVINELEIDDKPMAEMLVTAFPKKLIAQIHEVITRSGLHPLVLDTQANAFGKLIEHQFKINGNDDHRDNDSAFIDFGYESINVYLFHKGRFRFSRILHYGGKDLDMNIAKFMDIERDDARRKKLDIHNINYVVDEASEEAKVTNIIKSTIGSWLQEINTIFRYYGSRNSGFKNVEYIYIYGGLSNIDGLPDFIESHFKVPVYKVKKISSVDFQPNIDIVEVLNTLGVFYRR